MSAQLIAAFEVLNTVRSRLRSSVPDGRHFYPGGQSAFKRALPTIPLTRGDMRHHRTATVLDRQQIRHATRPSTKRLMGGLPNRLLYAHHPICFMNAAWPRPAFNAGHGDSTPPRSLFVKVARVRRSTYNHPRAHHRRMAPICGRHFCGDFQFPHLFGVNHIICKRRFCTISEVTFHYMAAL